MTRTPTRARGAGWHRPDVLSLVTGLLLTGIGLDATLLGRLSLDAGLLLGLVAVVGGLVLLATTLGSRDRPGIGAAATTVESSPPAWQPPIPSPAAAAEEDRLWFEQVDLLSDAEREVLEALSHDEQGPAAAGGGPVVSPG